MRQFAAIIISLLLPVSALASTGGVAAPVSGTSVNQAGGSAAPATGCANMAATGCHIVLNGHSNNPRYGNEAQFLTVANNTTGAYAGATTVQDGEVLALRVYIDNNANPKRIGDAAATAHNVKVSLAMPKNSTNHQVVIKGTIVAPKAMPSSLTSQVTLSAAQPFTLASLPSSGANLPSSATLRWAVMPSNRTLSESVSSLFGGGVTIATIHPGYGNSLELTVLVQVHFLGGQAPATPATPGAMTTPAQTQTTTVPAPSASANPAPTTPAPPASAPSTPSSQSTTQMPGSGQATTAVDDSTSDDVAVQSAQTQSQTQSQSQPQSQTAPATLPDTGTAAATGSTLGLTVLLLAGMAYRRSRLSLAQRRRLRA